MANLRCQRCGNTTLFKWKGRAESGARRFQCKVCGRRGRYHGEPETTFTQNGDERVLTLETTKDIQTEQDVLEEVKVHVNLEEWAIDKFRVGVSHAWRKDRSVDWQVENGEVIHGEVHDSGKILDHPQRTLQVWLKRRTKEIHSRLVVADLIADAKQFAPRYPKLTYPKSKEGYLLEVPCFDLHLGKLTWREESGENSDLKLQTRRARETLDELLGLVQNYPIERVLFILGGDYFNCDSTTNATTAGTQQSEDSRYQKVYRAGRQLAVEMIDRCSILAPVDVMVLSGNHDMFRSFALGDALQCWFDKCPNVKVDNSAAPRKYFAWKENLIGFSHGGDEKFDRLPRLMAAEAREYWSQARNCEFHCGHFHHQDSMFYIANEKEGMLVRLLRALTPPDAWHARKGFIGAVQSAEAFLWHPTRGVVVTLSIPAEKNLD